MKFKVGDKVKVCGVDFTQEQAMQHWKNFFQHYYGELVDETFVVVSTSKYCSMISNKIGNEGFNLTNESLTLFEESQETIVKETVTKVIPKGLYGKVRVLGDVQAPADLVCIDFETDLFDKQCLTNTINTLTQIRDFLSE